MPEGDTILGVARRMRSALVGKPIVSIDATYWCPSCKA